MLRERPRFPMFLWAMMFCMSFTMTSTGSTYAAETEQPQSTAIFHRSPLHPILGDLDFMLDLLKQPGAYEGQGYQHAVGLVGKSDSPFVFASAAGPIKTTLRKGALRTFLTLKAARSTGAQKTNLKKVLADRELFDAVFDGINEDYSSQHAGAVQDFLQWLLDNSDQIFALIAKLIAMFSADDKTSLIQTDGFIHASLLDDEARTLRRRPVIVFVSEQYDGSTPKDSRFRLPLALLPATVNPVQAGTCNGPGCSANRAAATPVRKAFRFSARRLHRCRGC